MYFKVRNNLDGCYYAIKRIELNPKNKQLNKKILREVKLLSRLNHENVVRYYNSWIETALIENDDTAFSKNIPFETSSKTPNKKDVCMIIRNIACLNRSLIYILL